MQPAATASRGSCGMLSPSTIGQKVARGPWLRIDSVKAGMWAANSACSGVSWSRWLSAGCKPSCPSSARAIASPASVSPKNSPCPELCWIARWKSPRAAGHPTQGVNCDRSRRLAAERDVVRVAAEALDVALHPVQRRDHVEQPGVTRRAPVAAATRLEIQVAERTEPRIDHDQHDLRLLREARLNKGHDARASLCEAADRKPHQDRAQRAGGSARRDGEPQAIFVARAGGHPSGTLGRRSLRSGRVELAAPARSCERRQETPCAHRCGSIRDAVEAPRAVLLHAADAAALGFNHDSDSLNPFFVERASPRGGRLHGGKTRVQSIECFEE